MGYILDSSNSGYCGFWSCSCSSCKVGNDGSSFTNPWSHVRINFEAEFIFMRVSVLFKLDTFWFQAALFFRFTN